MSYYAPEKHKSTALYSMVAVISNTCLEAAMHAPMLDVMPGEATPPNLYPYVWLKFGGKWVPFSSKVEQEGYNEVFFGLFSNMGTIFEYSYEATACLYHEGYIDMVNLWGLPFSTYVPRGRGGGGQVSYTFP